MPIPPKNPRLYDAVVIGASAGGVEALGVLLPALPREFDLPVVIVLHLSADRPSLLSEIFEKRCALPVIEASDKEPLKGGAIYFAPPDYHLMIELDKTCALSQDLPVHYSRPSIDVLFESAATAYGARVLGILLTGANSDGGRGLKAIETAGGGGWVQTPDSAYASAMPRSAIDLGAGQIMSLEQMAQRLRALAPGPVAAL